MAPRVLCIDFEASGLGRRGYPIEVALADPASGLVVSWLIRPTAAWQAEGEWQKAAEAVHGLTLARLEADGLPVELVAAEFLALARGTELLSDNPRFDDKWLGDLLNAAGIAEPPPPMADFDRFLREVAIIAGREAELPDAWERARARFPDWHRAGPDAARNAELLRLVGPSPAAQRSVAAASEGAGGGT